MGKAPGGLMDFNMDTGNEKHAKIDFQLTGFHREQSRTEFEFWLFDLNAKGENPANSCH